MKMGNRKVPEINSSSTADIAFIILIFFLVTTSMDTDRGLARRLPEPPQQDDNKPVMDIKKRNLLVVFLNKDDQLMVGDDYIQVSDLRKRVKEFVSNPYNDDKLPEKKAKDIPYFGSMEVTDQHVISLMNDRGTSYQAYISVQNELVAAYNELRNEVAQKKWGQDYVALNEEQQKAIRDIYPQRISEAEPKNYGEKKK
ncbi:biopolymer transporter ExbD [Bacteroides sp. 519]|uniref:ExbD/TolR family protein n=1 Tax=Bacteroides sp. 519 TaxID=2302937 RepID=UPI0013D76EDC|nr:biopolymer transporter ExbD [Bacteroides sp. 519]